MHIIPLLSSKSKHSPPHPKRGERKLHALAELRSGRLPKPRWIFCRHLMASLLLCLWFSGCASDPTRGLYDGIGGAAAAAAGATLSKGNPLITAGAAGGGVLITDLLQGMSDKRAAEKFSAGYDRGKSDAVKQQYWIVQNLQKDVSDPHPQEINLYPIAIPARTENGVSYSDSVQYLRVAR